MANEKRERARAKADLLAATHKLMIFQIDRVFFSQLIGNMKNLNLDESRKVGRIIDALDLEDFEGIDKGKRYDTLTIELSGYEVRFLLDAIEESSRNKTILAAWAKCAVNMYEALSDVLNPASSPVKKPEEPE